MTRVQRDSVAGRAYLDLQNLARRTGRPTAELLQLYALEGYLCRMGRTVYAPHLVLKGGVLLAAFDARRPTRDIDLAARHLAGDAEHVLHVARTIASVATEDGLDFEPAGAAAAVIRDQELYAGVRVRMPCTLAVARVAFHIDVNIGDPISPSPANVALPRLLGGHVDVLGYPLAMVHAEKIVTVIARGAANTRWRDFADIYLLSRTRDQDAAELVEAIRTVASYRQVQRLPLRESLGGFASTGQASWAAWTTRQALENRLPTEFAAVLAGVYAFADPVLDGVVSHGTWSSATGAWTTRTNGR